MTVDDLAFEGGSAYMLGSVLAAFFASYPVLRMAPRGDGHPVLVLPGLAANDLSTRPLRRFLNVPLLALLKAMLPVPTVSTCSALEL